MNSILVLVVGIGILIAGYVFYGKWAFPEISARLPVAGRAEGALPPRRPGRREGQEIPDRRTQRDAGAVPRTPQILRRPHRRGLRDSPHRFGGSPANGLADTRRREARHENQLFRRQTAHRRTSRAFRSQTIGCSYAPSISTASSSA